MDLAALTTADHKTLISQGKMSGAFNKSKHDIDVLTYSECQKILRRYTDLLLLVMGLSSTNTILRRRRQNS